MDAQPLTTLRSEDVNAGPRAPRTHTPTPKNNPGSSADGDGDAHQTSGSWSLKRLLSRRGSRRYRVLEREPNRLRKRVSQCQ
ncbi:hypothetical protein N7532_005352 [Penicillium argentinense]|uniref:Uncharacterized protein n=1 Tax=Penicillium argentinense TaxID=1131581 RepID=A0A9W9FDX3_9EURO|nr:uncharacterized protein N7532_005352 [Penicillium argentinense]KAJ5098351.1 hypothetical protein N7532_005352 [Penicillium argentinense]